MAYRNMLDTLTSGGRESSLENKTYESAVQPVAIHIKSNVGPKKVLTAAEVLSEADTRELELILDNIANMVPEQAIAVDLAKDSAGMFEASYDLDEGSFEMYNGTSLTTSDSQTELLILGGENFDGLSEAARGTIYNSITGDGALKEYAKSTSGQKSERDKLAKDSYDEQYKREERIRAEKLEDLSDNEPPMFKKYLNGRDLDYFLLVPTRGPIPRQVLLTVLALEKLSANTGQRSFTIKVDYAKEQHRKNEMRLVNNVTEMSMREARALAAKSESARSKNSKDTES